MYQQLADSVTAGVESVTSKMQVHCPSYDDTTRSHMHILI